MCAESIKLAIVGDGAVGKTCLLLAYLENQFPQIYQPTVFEKYSGSIVVNGRNLELKLYDTAGQSDHEHLRKLMYSGVDAVILCFSVVHEISYENVRYKWSDELTNYLPNVPVILVGTKIDLRNQIKPGAVRVIAYDQGSRLAKRINAASYVECSALESVNVKTVFDHAISLVLERRSLLSSKSSKKEKNKRKSEKSKSRHTTKQTDECQVQ